jgi:hypothetical protein
VGEEVKPLIIYAEGKGFTLIRDNKAEYIDFLKQKPVGLELKTGDRVNVEARTSIELQLFPTMTVIRVSESSSFVIKAIRASGSCDIDVIFGRLRTKIDEKKAAATFLINNVDITSDAVGTDFGYDAIFTSEKVLEYSIYCFQGALAVSRSTFGMTGSGTPKVIRVLAQEMVRVTDAGNGGIELAKTQQGTDVKSFWQKNDIISPPLKTSDTDTALKETAATDIATTPNTSNTLNKDSAFPAHVDNTEGAIGAREKLSALNQRDADVNPDFSKGNEKVAATTTSPETEKKDAVKEEPAKDATTAAKDETKKETPPETADTTPQKAGPPVVTVQMDMGFKIDYLSLNWPIPANPSIPDMEFITGLFDIINHLQLGFVLDFNVMFWDIIGIGVESGLRYNTLLTVGLALPPTIVMLHYFWIPILIDIRFTLGPLFIQPYGGILLAVNTESGALAFNSAISYEAGAKAGLRLGNLVIFGEISWMSDSMSTIFSPTAQLQFGGGLLFKIF